MAHFAEIEDGIVVNVIVAEQDFIDTLEGTWVQTSYNTWGGKHFDPETGEEDDGTPLRKNYAFVGCVYDAERDAFYAVQPHDSWTLNEDTCQWEAPYPRPEETEEELASPFRYVWNEESYNADNTQGWVLVDESQP